MARFTMALVHCAGSAHAQIDVGVVEGSFFTPDALDFIDSIDGVNGEAIPPGPYTPNILSQYDVVLHYGNSFYDQALLEGFIANGGLLISTPWMNNNQAWYVSKASPIAAYDSSNVNFMEPLSVTVLDAGHPYLSGVSFNNGDEVGWEGNGTLAPGAVALVTHDDGAGPAVSYIDFGEGRCVYLNLHYITSDTTIAMNYDWGRQLLENVILSVGESCAADVDGDGALTILDFVAFQGLFLAGDPGADCDDNGVLNVLDFVCFQLLFEAGCP